MTTIDEDYAIVKCAGCGGDEHMCATCVCDRCDCIFCMSCWQHVGKVHDDVEESYTCAKCLDAE